MASRVYHVSSFHVADLYSLCADRSGSSGLLASSVNAKPHAFHSPLGAHHPLNRSALDSSVNKTRPHAVVFRCSRPLQIKEARPKDGTAENNPSFPQATALGKKDYALKSGSIPFNLLQPSQNRRYSVFHFQNSWSYLDLPGARPWELFWAVRTDKPNHHWALTTSSHQPKLQV